MKKERREACRRHLHRRLTGKDLTEKAWDDFLRSMDTGSRKWAGPISTGLFDDRRTHGRRHLAGDGQAQRTYIAGAINSSGPTRSTDATGAASRIIPSCISRSAIIRRSTSPSSGSLEWSRRVRKASTSWRGAIGRWPCIRRITSPIPACAMRCPITSSVNGTKSNGWANIWKSIRRSARIWRIRTDLPADRLPF